MSILSLAKKHLLLLLVVSAIYFAYVSIVLKPWSFKNFSLIDDGQVYVQSSSYFEDCILRLDCSKFFDQTFEYGTNRFRPSYWVTQNILYEIFRDNAQAHHVFRVYIVGYSAVILLSLILLDMRTRPLLVLISSALYFSNYSFTENILRIGPSEPYQIVLLALFSILYLKKDEFRKKSKLFFPFLTVLLIWTVLIKENSAAVLAAIFFSALTWGEFNNSKKTLTLTIIPALVLGLGIIISKLVPSEISTGIPAYTRNYSFSIRNFVTSFGFHLKSLVNSLSPFLKLTLFGFPILYFVSRKFKIYLTAKKFIYWLFFTIFFIGIMLPWRFVLERYQLVAIFGLIVVIAYLLDKGLFLLEASLFRKTSSPRVYRLLFAALIFFGAANLFFRGFPINFAKSINYRNWYLTFTTFESEQVRAIAKYNDKKIYLNAKETIGSWEVLYEIPIHLKFLYGLEPNYKLLSPEPTNANYVFSRLPFDPILELPELQEKGYQVVEADSYHVDQIDPIKFRKHFALKPISTIVNPPLSDDSLDYYWEIRKLEK